MKRKRGGNFGEGEEEKDAIKSRNTLEERLILFYRQKCPHEDELEQETEKLYNQHPEWLEDYISTLPGDMKLHLLQFLTTSAVTRLGATSKGWRRFIESERCNTMWKRRYKMDLYDFPICDTVPADVLWIYLYRYMTELQIGLETGNDFSMRRYLKIRYQITVDKSILLSYLNIPKYNRHRGLRYNLRCMKVPTTLIPFPLTCSKRMVLVKTLVYNMLEDIADDLKDNLEIYFRTSKHDVLSISQRLWENEGPKGLLKQISPESDCYKCLSRVDDDVIASYKDVRYELDVEALLMRQVFPYKEYDEILTLLWKLNE